MLNGIIFVKDSIISLDLQTSLSKQYRIVNVFRNIEDAPTVISGIDFIILDSDPYSEQELRLILENLNISQDVKIITITSRPTNKKNNNLNNVDLYMPFNNDDLKHAIEKSTED